MQNFNVLVQHTKNADYLMFCDQDDVWLPFKIEYTLNEMISFEKVYSQNMPLLVHTNFLYVDEALKPIESKKNYEATKIKSPVFSNVLCQNSVYGCTMMINKKLVDVTGSIPVEAENHDYWYALTASAFGKIFYLSKRTILYRQHQQNASTQHDFNSFSKRFKRIIVDKKNFKDVEWKMKMALVYKRRYYEYLSAHNKKVIDDFIALFNKRTISLMFCNIKNGIRRQTFNQTFLFYFTLIFIKKQLAD